MAGTDERVPVRALQLCGIVSLEEGGPLRLAEGFVVSLRDLGALVREIDWGPVSSTDGELVAYRAVVESAFASRCVVPAPFGTVFRSREALLRWMELHYFTLADALRYLQDRQVARVRVTTGPTARVWDTREHISRGADLEVTAFDSFRMLRRQAVAFVPLPGRGRVTDEGAEAAFLVEREQWNAFVSAVKDEQRRLPDVQFEQTGPWPPYDFVRLDLDG